MTDDVTPQPGRRSHVKWLAALIVVAAFATGVLVGVAGDRVLMVVRHETHLSPAMMHGLVERIEKRLDRRLDLTPEQSRQVRAILDRHQQNILRVWRVARPQVQLEIESANSEIAAVLTPEQKAKFERMKMHLPKR